MAVGQGTRASVAVKPVEWPWWWIVPRSAWGTVTALLLVGGLWLGNQFGLNSTAEETTPSLLAALSNHSSAACLAMVEVRHNAPGPILGLTNGENSLSTNRSLDQLTTNRLLLRL